MEVMMIENLKSLEKEMKVDHFTICAADEFLVVPYIFTNNDYCVGNYEKYNGLDEVPDMMNFFKDTFVNKIEKLVVNKGNFNGFPLFDMTYKGIKYKITVDEEFGILLHEEVPNGH